MGAAGSLDHLWRAGSHDAHLFVALAATSQSPAAILGDPTSQGAGYGASAALRPALPAFSSADTFCSRPRRGGPPPMSLDASGSR